MTIQEKLMNLKVGEAPGSRVDNVALNNLEFAERKIELRSTPRLVVLGTHNACNAKCIFCLESRYSRFDLQLYKDFFESKMGSYIRNAEKVTFTGWGEILWIPGIEEFLDYINETIPDVEKIFTTNATPLRPSVIERILRTRYVIQASVHASNAKLHQELTLLENEFDNVVGNLARLADERDRLRAGSKLHLQIINVLTRKNIDDLPDFVRMAAKLKIYDVRASHLTMHIPEHIEMSCFFDQERANRRIAEARALAEEFGKQEPHLFRASLPPAFNPAEPEPEPSENVCYDPWQNTYVELQGSVMPCCFWGEHIGNLNHGDSLDDIWNGEVYKELRRGMGSGNPHPWCRNCVRYRGSSSINSIYTHITNRPREQLKMLEAIVARGLDAGPMFKQEHIADLRRKIDAMDAAEAAARAGGNGNRG
jgi:MoaA/NifB/PqqE/SkfB family radical SAM enzyme